MPSCNQPAPSNHRQRLGHTRSVAAWCPRVACKSQNKSMVRAGTILTLFVAATVSADVVARKALSPFVVGILGQENAIIPFADFDGRLWRNSWPNFPDGDRDLIPLERNPQARCNPAGSTRPRRSSTANGRRRNLQNFGNHTSARLGSDCSGSVALTTDLPEKTYQYAVLAANRPGIVRPIRSLTPDSADWRVLVALCRLCIRSPRNPRGNTCGRIFAQTCRRTS